ncbi:enoyl-[acyl-carrier-protein] reductase [NADH] [Actinoplanes sp. NBRC 14428]|uniref:Enoyl-[acyl-carrier-protein] reductase [NADH] n=1 Tax=Pseudosporangium ferrugineum TaxID=439699 RepID=A0A2T0SAQ6_9ACTN|nr:enoyl-ACP reductase FabI [Pseudosporangium ferrugineum]PRY30498.1 enoyl-[acyl-carrier-protein] reductase [NADH] [Pseudosporangium ferrugineum]BCJ50034.1 enoyl-[acyl-carrier-protein] reductase [NADH] [Actinoplanes sp. NBRC 14428]
MIPHDGRRYLVTGVLNEDSIAWHTAAALQSAGAEVILTGFGRSRRITELAAAQLPKPAPVLELDATNADDYRRLAADLAGRWPSLDGIVHAIAAAPADAHSGNFLTTPPRSAVAAFHTATVSLHSLTVHLLDLLRRSPDGASIVALDFDAATAWYGYDWMGVSKAALESLSRYLALYLGSSRIRVNLVAVGPVETIAGSAISTFDDLARRWEREAPLGWDRRDSRVAAGAVLFLLSGLARGITGEILHVDGGMHAVSLGVRDGRPPGGADRPPPSDEET